MPTNSVCIQILNTGRDCGGMAAVGQSWRHGCGGTAGPTRDEAIQLV